MNLAGYSLDQRLRVAQVALGLHVQPKARRLTKNPAQTQRRAGRQRWAAAQEAKLLPVPYYLLTVTVPAELRRHCRRDARTLYDLLLTQSAAALRDLCRNPKHLGGETGFLAVLQTWTRRMLLHPHVHLLIPAVALSIARRSRAAKEDDGVE